MGRRWEAHVVSGVRVFGAQPTHSCFEESFFGSLLKCVWVTAAPQVMWSTDSVRVFTVDGGWVWTFAAVGPLKRRVRGLAGVQVCVVDSRSAPTRGQLTGRVSGRRHPPAGEVVDDEHASVVAPGTPPQRATGQRLIAVPIVGGGAGGLLCRWWRRRGQQPPTLGQLLLPVAIGEEARSSECGGSRAGARGGACGG